MNNSVSVVIATFNSAGFLGETLESSCRQTRRPREVIVSDDASTDGTPELVEDIARSSSVPIRLIRSHSNSGGPASPLNRGIAASSGDIIATLDHDDRLLPTKLERCVSCFEAMPDLGMVATRCHIPDADDRLEEAERWQAAMLSEVRTPPLAGGFARLDRKAAYARLIQGNFLFTCSSMMFRRETWRRLDGFDEGLRLTIDYDFLRRCLEVADVGYVDEALTIWTSRPDSLYRTARARDRRIESLRVLSAMRRSDLSHQSRVDLDSNIRQEALATAYDARNGGHYRLSASMYLHSIRRGSPSLEAIAGLAKLLPHYLLRRGRGASPRERSPSDN